MSVPRYCKRNEMLAPRRLLDFRIIDETDDYVVVDKPPFVLVHPTKPGGLPTLWNQLRELLAFEIANGGQVSIVNRLDRETSGLVLVAKTSTVARKFGLLMERRQLRKEYLAIVSGWPEWETNVVHAPLDRQGKHENSMIWLKQGIHSAGATAQTEFRVERRFRRSTLQPSPVASQLPLRGQGEGQKKVHGENSARCKKEFALIRAIPHTGRTHQIRVHLASIGHSIVGDKIYGPDEQLYLKFIETGWTRELERRLLLPRHALHSAKLRIDGETEWESPLPADLARFMSESEIL